MTEKNHPDKRDTKEPDEQSESVDSERDLARKRLESELERWGIRIVKNREEAAENRRRRKQARDERIRRRKEEKQALENQENNKE